MSSESSATTTSESEVEIEQEEEKTETANKGPIDVLQDKFPRIPRQDICRGILKYSSFVL